MPDRPADRRYFADPAPQNPADDCTIDLKTRKALKR